MKPRHELCLVERQTITSNTTSGIYIPNDGSAILQKFKIIAVGPKVEDLKIGDLVLAEDAMQQIDKISLNKGLLHQKYIHLIL